MPQTCDRACETHVIDRWFLAPGLVTPCRQIDGTDYPHANSRARAGLRIFRAIHCLGVASVRAVRADCCLDPEDHRHQHRALRRQRRRNCAGLPVAATGSTNHRHHPGRRRCRRPPAHIHGDPAAVAGDSVSQVGRWPVAALDRGQAADHGGSDGGDDLQRLESLGGGAHHRDRGRRDEPRQRARNRGGGAGGPDAGRYRPADLGTAGRVRFDLDHGAVAPVSGAGVGRCRLARLDRGRIADAGTRPARDVRADHAEPVDADADDRQAL